MEFEMRNPINNFLVETTNQAEKDKLEYARAFHIETFTFDMRKFTGFDKPEDKMIIE